MSFKMGFYDELDLLQKDNIHTSFGFLQNIDVTDENTAFNYLHGCCDEFAGMLSAVYGYEIECLRNAEHKLIHAYCVTELDGEKAYVDVRGITTDPKLFYEEFENEMTYCPADGSFYVIDEEGYEVPAIFETWADNNKLFDGDYEGWHDESVCDFIRAYSDYYNVDKCAVKARNSVDDKIRLAEEIGADSRFVQHDREDGLVR